MKRLLFLIFVLLSAWPSFSAEQEEDTLVIFLVRHAKVDLKKPFLCTSRKAAELMKAYNNSPIRPFDPGPVRELIGQEKITVYTSELPRTIATARVLFPEADTLRASVLFNESGSAMIEVPLILLPYPVWTTLSRVFWFTHLNRHQESRSEALSRAKQATDQLIRIASTEGPVVLVSHGFLISDLKKQFRKKGWVIEFAEGNRNLAVTKLTGKK